MQHFCSMPCPSRAQRHELEALAPQLRRPVQRVPAGWMPLRRSRVLPRLQTHGAPEDAESPPCLHPNRRLPSRTPPDESNSGNQGDSEAHIEPPLPRPLPHKVRHGRPGASIDETNSPLLVLRLARRPLSIFRGSRWLVGFGLAAFMLTHESNQPPTYFNDSGDTTRNPRTRSRMQSQE